MNDNDQQKAVSNFVAALAHTLCGKAGRVEEFISKTRIVVTGHRPKARRNLRIDGTALLLASLLACMPESSAQYGSLALWGLQRCRSNCRWPFCRHRSAREPGLAGNRNVDSFVSLRLR